MRQVVILKYTSLSELLQYLNFLLGSEVSRRRAHFEPTIDSACPDVCWDHVVSASISFDNNHQTRRLTCMKNYIRFCNTGFPVLVAATCRYILSRL